MSKQLRSNKVSVLPEVVQAHRLDDNNTEQWTVTSGSTNRGDSFTNFGEHTFRAPSLNDEVSRVIRGHELTHVRISPTDPVSLAKYAEVYGLSERSIACAEEVRVNAVLKGMGYDTDLLVDGSEKELGKRVAKEGSIEAYNEMINFGSALIGGKAFRHYISGVRSVNPDWANTLREMEKQVVKIVRKHPVRRMGSTEPRAFYQDDETLEYTKLPQGFIDYTTQIAQVIDGFLEVQSDGTNFEDGEGSSGVKVSTGYGKDQFAPLRIDTKILCDQQVKGHLARRKKSAPTGKRVLYPSRLLTDPQRRVFSQKPRNSGGIVVIDMSGSMSLSEADINAMLEAAPGALVAGYTNSAKKRNRPNFWIMANRGKRVSSLKGIGGNIGNGCDGPALEWAISKRRGSEPIIWVCDGQVTDSQDNGFIEGAKQCAKMIKKHRILITPNVSDAVGMLANPSNAKSKAEGYVGMFIKGEWDINAPEGSI